MKGECSVGLMGAEIIKFLRTAKMNGIQGKSIAMIGKQALNANPNLLLSAVSAMGLTYDKRLAAKITTDYRVDSYEFFKMFGFSEVHAVDYSDYEGADFIFDLNSRDAFPEELKGAFDYVINGGTIEHVFDIAAAMTNITQMVKPGGIVMHISPSEMWPNHGFYSISPTCFTDFYATNNYDVLELEFEFVMGDSTKSAPFVCFSDDLRLLRDANQMRKYVKSFLGNFEFESAMVVCIAQKLLSEQTIKYPIQGRYQAVYNNGACHKIPLNSIYFDSAAKAVKEFQGKQALYGCGVAGNLLLNELHKIDGEKSILAVFDGDASKAGKNHRGLLVVYPTEEKLAEFDRIVICSADYEGEIESAVLKKGVSPKKILKLSEFMES